MKDPRDRFDPRNRPEDPRDIARRELRRGETLVWADRPSPAAVKKRKMKTLVFAVPFTAFACFWIAMASQGFGKGVMGTVFPFFGLPFLLTGIWMLLAPLRAAREATSTIYAITDQRVFIAGGRDRTVRSFGPHDLTKVERLDHGDGLGDVVFAEEVSWRSGNNRYGVRLGNYTQTEDVGFFGIPEAREVEVAIAKLRRSAFAPESAPA